MRIDIVGDSHMARMEHMPFKLDAEIVYWNKRGGVTHLEQSLVRIREDPSRNISRDIVIIFMGGNDLDAKDVAVKKLATRISLAINEVARVAGVVAIMRQWPRPGARQGVNYWTNVNYFHYLLPEMLVMNSYMWAWDRSMQFGCSFFDRDGVHCKPKHHKKVVRYITSAILAGIKFLIRRGIIRPIPVKK